MFCLSTQLLNSSESQKAKKEGSHSSTKTKSHYSRWCHHLWCCRAVGSHPETELAVVCNQSVPGFHPQRAVNILPVSCKGLPSRKWCQLSQHSMYCTNIFLIQQGLLQINCTWDLDLGVKHTTGIDSSFLWIYEVTLDGVRLLVHLAPFCLLRLIDRSSLRLLALQGSFNQRCQKLIVAHPACKACTLEPSYKTYV